jgi:hypothetical protein
VWVKTKETGARHQQSRLKGRQGSVHRLVDLWGGKDVCPKSSGGGLSPGPISESGATSESVYVLVDG